VIRRSVFPRRSARLRLTLWYGGIVLLTGFTLLSLTYVLVSRSLRGDPGGVKAAIERQLARHVHEVTVPQPPQGGLTAESRNAGFPDGLPARFFQVDGPVETTTIPTVTTERTSPGRFPGKPDGERVVAPSQAVPTTVAPTAATVAGASRLRTSAGSAALVSSSPPSRVASPTIAASSGPYPTASPVNAGRSALSSAATVPKPAATAPGPASTSTTVPEYVLTLPALQRGTIAEVMHSLVQQSAIALALLAVFSLVIGWVMAGRVLRPVREITDAARRLSERNLHERIALQGPDDELRELADTFDAMLSRLDSAFALQRDFVANASHELRTPLTIIRTDLDVTMSDPEASIADYQAMAATIHDATVRSERLIEALLTLARTDGPVDRTALDLAELAQNTATPLLELRVASGLRIETSLAPAPVVGDRSLLERLVANLVENAIRYNCPDGWLALETQWRGDQAVLTVANSGDRIEPAEVGLLFQRFYRRDPSRNRATGGAGLGLSIVDAVVRTHGGQVEARALAGGGLRVSVALPTVPRLPESEGFAADKQPIKALLTTPLSGVS
jgi:signal transduction histidine kinase